MCRACDFAAFLDGDENENVVDDVQSVTPFFFASTSGGGDEETCDERRAKVQEIRNWTESMLASTVGRFAKYQKNDKSSDYKDQNEEDSSSSSYDSEDEDLLIVSVAEVRCFEVGCPPLDVYITVVQPPPRIILRIKKSLFAVKKIDVERAIFDAMSVQMKANEDTLPLRRVYRDSESNYSKEKFVKVPERPFRNMTSLRIYKNTSAIDAFQNVGKKYKLQKKEQKLQLRVY
eukprot:g2917.t1